MVVKSFSTNMQQELQSGYNNLVQFDEVSSSSDLFHWYPNPKLFPVGRPTYRRYKSFLFRPKNITVQLTSLNPVSSHGPHICAEVKKNDVITNRFATITVVLIFLCSLSALFLVYASFPNLEENEKVHIKIPWNIEEAKQLGIVLNRYKDDNYFQLLTGVFVTYIFLQTFAIPGSLFLSILSGFLFPFFAALLLVCTCSAVGASLCFLLSQLLGRRLVKQYFPERAEKWAVMVNKHRDNLLNYVIFLRVTPFLPNWFINLTAPVIGVPLVPFALGTFLGVAPPSFVAIQAGQTLHKMSATDSAFSWTSVIMLGVFAVVSLIPIFLKQRLKEKFE